MEYEISKKQNDERMHNLNQLEKTLLELEEEENSLKKVVA